MKIKDKTPNSLRIDKALLVGVDISDNPKVLSLEDSLSELRKIGRNYGRF